MTLQAALTVGALLAASVASAADPLATSPYFKTTGSGAALEIKGGAKSVFFGISLEALKPLPKGAVIAAEFDNPLAAAAPLKAGYTPKPGEKTVTLRSDALDCVVNNRNYTITVRLYADAAHRKLLGTHIQNVSLKIPQSAIEQVGIKECGS